MRRGKIRDGTWIDAGCGQGAYTIPLATQVEKVYAIDQNKKAIQVLNSRLQQLEITNVECTQASFNDIRQITEKNCQGVLFAFSLHYQENIEFLTEILQEKETQEHFKIVIIEYMRTEPVYWVPNPCPPEKVINKIPKNGSYRLEINYQNDRYYILTMYKENKRIT